MPGLVGHICPDYGVPKMKGVKHARHGQRGHLPEGVSRIREDRHDAALHRDEPGRRPHHRHDAGHVHAGGVRRQQRPGAGPAGRGASRKAKYWKETAIFVIEDDAQNGPDHVDAHRTVGLVISPYTKRKVVDSTQYSTVSMIRTMELILGLPPLSQYDAAARPMFDSFTDKADLTPYKGELARIDLDAKNTQDGVRRRAVEQDGLQRLRPG